MTDHPAIDASTSPVAQLLGRAPDSDALNRATGEVAAKADDLRSLTRSLFVFRLGGEWLGLPAAIVDEVLEPRPIHSLPHRREGLVRGLVNVRGQLTVCVALESLLQIDAARTDPERSSASAASVLGRRLVVLSLQDQRLAFESDEVHGAHRYDPALVGEVPGTVALASAAFSTGVLAMEARSVGLLDDGLMLSAINRRLG
ncbi:chemotaxis protein CheW [Lysobacter sp. Root690]|uniref:chemotaxis protein CheW n=1 Tax=Lysobacter sp. Root690 TaxID=1736588 RepID=UPI000700C0A3|nr:chemotaxis protein CheW [Lysobacter sp. Root690]KRB04259.1 hypothetical protein ASD86_18200 [Lysobacter sp. Root690]